MLEFLVKESPKKGNTFWATYLLRERNALV